jgi:hypothetical protein
MLGEVALPAADGDSLTFHEVGDLHDTLLDLALQVA